MNILLLGSGGREHALAHKIAASKHCSQLFIAPGNAGTRTCGTNVALDMSNASDVVAFCVQQAIDIVVVGPEEPLVQGLADVLQQSEAIKAIKPNFFVVGPGALGAQLEGSKAFSKQFMQRHGIPTAAYAEFTAENYEAGKAYIAAHSLPIVLKADGLAAGKGVVIAPTHAEALATFEQMIIGQQFGVASNKVVVEAFLTGIEVSVFVLTNGKQYRVLGHAKDYKRIGEGDTGPNTGGMGCVTPVPFMNDAFMQQVTDTIIEPTIQGLATEGIPYNGFIFFGLIKVGEQPMVIEYNCRMGDPETEVVMPRLQNDLVELFLHMHQQTLDTVTITMNEGAFATVVAVSGGYPGNYPKGLPITLNEVALSDMPATTVYHAGTALHEQQVVTNGGRVLAVTSTATTITDAVALSKAALRQIDFAGMNYRNDIGYEFAS